MTEDWVSLKKELDRVEGNTFDFGTYAGWRVSQVGWINPRYLCWCLEAVPLRPELRRVIVRVLAHAAGRTRARRSAVRLPAA